MHTSIKQILLSALIGVVTLSMSLSVYAQCTMPDDGLIGHWKLDEASGTLSDSSEYGNDGTAVGGPQYGSSGVIYNALDFDGVDDSVTLNANPELNLQYPMSLSAWVNIDLLPTTAGNNFSIIARDDDDPDRVFEFRITEWAPEANKIDFSTYPNGNGTGQQNTYSTTAFTAGDIGGWTHVGVTVDRQGNVNFYRNGAADGTGNIGNLTIPSTSSLTRIGGANNFEFDGQIDDVRFYNRALSGGEVAALYSLRSTSDAQAGQLAYDTKYARMMYCNGTDWVHAGLGTYNAGAIFLDSADQIRNPALLTGVGNSKQISGSMWFKTSASIVEIFDSDASGGEGDITVHPILNQDGDGDAADILLRFANLSNVNVISVEIDDVGLDDDQWHHLMFSFNVSGANTTTRHVVLDGVLLAEGSGASQAEYVTWVDDYMEFTPSGALGYSIGSNTTGGNDLDGQIAEFWIDFGTYIDLSDKNIREKFISEDGLPVYLGADGSLPTGNTADIFLTGPTESWHVNKGSGGGFTVTSGEIDTASSGPGSALLGIDLDSNLVANWQLNEASGTTAIEFVSWDGTMQGGLDAGNDSVYGRFSSALNFDGVDDRITVDEVGTTDLDFANTEDITITAWVKADAAGAGSWRGIVTKESAPGDALNANYLIQLSDLDEFLFSYNDTGNTWHEFRSDATQYFAGEWIHYAATYTFGTAGSAKLYVNGIEVAGAWDNGDGTGVPRNHDAQVNIGSTDNSGTGSEFWDGEIDDVRIYRRILSASEIKALSSLCLEGMMKYNQEFNVMEYCNGTDWVAMGLVGGTPSATNLELYLKLDETSGTAAADSSGFGRNGVLQGDGIWRGTTGVVDGSIEFTTNDDGDGVRVTPNAIFNSVPFSVSVWFKSDTAPGTSDTIVVNRNPCSPCRNWRVNIGSTGSVGFRVENAVGTGFNTNSNAPVSFGEWHHVVAILDANFDTLLYVDGVKQTDTENTVSLGPATAYLQVGVEDSVGANELDGQVDEVRYYSRVLSDNDVLQLYHFGLSKGLGDVNNGCTNPARDEGVMLYNTDENVLQYCNGEYWVGVGK